MKRRTDTTQFTFMTEYLREQSTIDPLSIDQTSLYEHSAAHFDHPLYALALQKHPQQTAFVLRSDNTTYEVFGRYQQRVDMQVIHPRYQLDPSTQRFTWLALLGELSPVDVPTDLLPKQGRRVIYAYRLTDASDAVPLDAVVVEAGQSPPKFMLPNGVFRFTFEE